jgi:PAS domain S-box-containing protein
MESDEITFDQITDNHPVLVWVCDPEKNCLFLNKYWREFTGTGPEKTFLSAWLNDLYPEDLHDFTAKLESAIASKGTFQYRFRLRHTSGEYHWVAGTASPFFNSKKEFAGFTGSGLDVHETYKQFEREASLRTEGFRQKNEALEQKSHLIEAVLDSTISMISVVDKDFNVISFNHKAEEYLGVVKAEVIGRNIFEIFPYLRTTSYKEQAKRALAGEIVHTHISPSALQKGKYFETFFIPLKSIIGEVNGVIVKVRDRTEDVLLQHKLIENNKLLEEQNRALKRQSQFIESLFDATVDVIAVFDKDHRYISMNKKGLEKYGYKKEELIGKKLLEIFPAVENSGMYHDLERAFKGEFVYDLSYTSTVLDKTQFENYYVPLFDDQNNVYAVMLVGHDISELADANEKLRVTNETLAEKNSELQRSNEDLEQFAYVASHDLQEPVRKIATYTDKLLTRSKEKLSEETTMYLERINKSTGRMYELINGLLLYSRLRRENNLFTPTSLDSLFKQVLTDFELKIQQQKAVINCQRLPDIEAVPVQINQMFTNLVSNSLKFAKKDVTPVIQVAASDLTQEQKKFYHLNAKARYVNIFYLDNGIGFEQQYADKIFELFQRLHDRNRYEGSGLGLAICKKIVSNHHGLIYAFSEPHKGVTFQIILPYQQKGFS